MKLPSTNAAPTISVPRYGAWYGVAIFLANLAIVSSVAFPFMQPVVAVASAPAVVSVFVRDDCAHCGDEKVFLGAWQREDTSLTVRYYNLAESSNTVLFSAVAERYRLPQATPLTLVRDTLVSGFDTPETTGERLRAIASETSRSVLSFEEIAESRATARVDTGVAAGCSASIPCSVTQSSLYVTLPFVGTRLDVGRLSLSALAFTLGFIDGFNPCAMWVLVMFLIILSQAGSRRRMWEYAGLFIVAEATMYYFILNVWYTVWDFVALDRIVTPFVGFLALSSGSYFLYKFWTHRDTCDVTNLEQRSRLSRRARDLAARPLTLVVALGILALAFSVNIFEFACSIGIPQTFTKVLELNGVSWGGHQWYMLIYIIAYMLDDLVVFGLALWSFEKVTMMSRYSRWSSLVGGLLMLALGAILIIRPALLIF